MNEDEEWWDSLHTMRHFTEADTLQNSEGSDWVPEDLKPQTWPKPTYAAEGDLIAPAPGGGIENRSSLGAPGVWPGLVQISWTPSRTHQMTRLQIEFTDELLADSRLSVLETVLFAVREHLMNAGVR